MELVKKLFNRRTFGVKSVPLTSRLEIFFGGAKNTTLREGGRIATLQQAIDLKVLLLCRLLSVSFGLQNES